jgi:ribosome-associated protein
MVTCASAERGMRTLPYNGSQCRLRNHVARLSSQGAAPLQTPPQPCWRCGLVVPRQRGFARAFKSSVNSPPNPLLLRKLVSDDEETSTPADALRLDHFLKMNHLSGSGGGAKMMIQGGEVKLNGEVETRRRRKLHSGDIVEVGGKRLVVP